MSGREGRAVSCYMKAGLMALAAQLADSREVGHTIKDRGLKRKEGDCLCHPLAQETRPDGLGCLRERFTAEFS